MDSGGLSWRSYAKSVLVEARSETIRIIKHQALWDALVFAAGAIIGLLIFQEPWQRVVGVFGGGIVGLALVIVLVGAWSLTWAPLNVARVDKRRINTLESFSNPHLDVIASFPRYFDSKLGLYIALTEVRIINRSDRSVNLDVELHLHVEQKDGSTIGIFAQEMYVPNDAIVTALPDEEKHGGLLHSPLMIQAKDRALGFFVFKLDAAGRKQVNLNDPQDIQWVDMTLTDGVTNVMKTYPVPDTVEDVIALSDERGAEKDA